MCNVLYRVPVLLLFAAHAAAAMALDTLIPAGIPGLGAPPSLSLIGQAPPGSLPVPVQFGGLTLSPSLSAGFGYDSAPAAGTPGSLMFNAQPKLVAADPFLGLGAYVAANTQYLPAEPSQNVAGYTVAIGEAAELPTQKLTLAGGYARAALTDFGIDALNLTTPLDYTVGGLTAGDRLDFGEFSLAPEISYADVRFDGSPSLDFTQLRQRAEIGYQPGGPMRVVTMLEATQSDYRIAATNANSYAALTGLEDDQTGLWDVRLLAGAAWRVPAQGAVIAAPVLEAALVWAPTPLTRVNADIERELDDPDQISPAGYKLTQADLSVTHELRRDIDLAGAFQAAHAVYFQGARTEDVYTADATLTWHLNAALALNGAYAFADRQANFARAANQHVFTFNAVWTP
jgi:hypothetical protein